MRQRSTPHLALADKSFFELVFGQSPDTIPEIPPSGEAGARMELLGKINGVCFTNGVNALRNPKIFPSPRLNAAVQILWELAGNKLPVSVAETTGTLRFWYEPCGSRTKKEVVCIVIPANFYVKCFMEPVAQMEALGFIASRVRDWRHKKLRPERHSNWRAVGYSAEVLRIARMAKPDMKLSPVQTQIADFLPNGLDSFPEELLYD